MVKEAKETIVEPVVVDTQKEEIKPDKKEKKTSS
jgi:hypothetical protein